MSKHDHSIDGREVNDDADDGAGLEDAPAAAGRESFWVSDDCPPELLAEFRRGVAAYEQAPLTTHFRLLEEAGVNLPPPESLDKRGLSQALRGVIEGLARLRVFLDQTDHLSDRELYARLWGDALREEVPDLPLDESAAWHIDLAGSGSEEDIRVWLRYYADEETRRRWRADFPADEMPPREQPPYDRDRLLPQAGGRGHSDESDLLM
jgi:hypothetical protein